MAEIPEVDLFLDEFSTVDSFPYCPDHRMMGDLFEIGNGVVSSLERKNEVDFVMDLINQSVEESVLMNDVEIRSNNVNELSFGLIEEGHDVDHHNLELGLGSGLVNHEQDNHEIDQSNLCGDMGDDNLDLELGLGFLNQQHVDNDNEDFDFSGLDDFKNCDEHLSRVSGSRPVWIESDSDSDDDVEVKVVIDESSSRVSGSSGLRHVWIESESDSDEGVEVKVEVEVEGIDDVRFGMDVHSNEDDIIGLNNMNWDSFFLEEEEDNREVNRDFEWEEVYDRDYEREVLSFEANIDDEELSMSVLNISRADEEGERENRSSNLEWEVLLNNIRENNLDSNSVEDDDMNAFREHDDYEIMFAQFFSSNDAFMARPPTSKAAIENLSSVVITEKDFIDEKSLCAVCKDHIEVGKEGKELPCSHCYHGDCIIPWLEIRNTCPVCRFELPTNDHDYRLRMVSRLAPA